MRINRIKWIILHHEGGRAGFNAVNEYHRKKWNFKSSLNYFISYHWYIPKQGKAIQARADTDEGMHVRGMNLSSISICLEGNFSREGQYPTESQKVALKGLLLRYMKFYQIPLARIVPHRFFKATECYGNNLSDSFARDLASQETQKYNDIKKSLLRKQISIIERLIKIYVQLLNLKRSRKIKT